MENNIPGSEDMLYYASLHPNESGIPNVSSFKTLH